MTNVLPRAREATAERTATRRRYLMCPPAYFAVTYAINPWMDPDAPVSRDLAFIQWDRLRSTYVDLGHQVDVIDPVEGLPDMVFAANGATVVGGVVLGARFRYPQRAPEAEAYRAWFRAAGFTNVREPRFVNEGEGDLLVIGNGPDAVVLAGTGFRTDPRAHAEVAAVFNVDAVVSLELVDDRFYHLDTAIAVLDDDTIAWLPEAFSPASQAVIRERFPDAIVASREDAAVLGLNAVSDGRHVVLPEKATRLADAVAERGFVPVPVDTSELLKAGGGPKCCTLEIRPSTSTGIAGATAHA